MRFGNHLMNYDGIAQVHWWFRAVWRLRERLCSAFRALARCRVFARTVRCITRGDMQRSASGMPNLTGHLRRKTANNRDAAEGSEFSREITRSPPGGDGARERGEQRLRHRSSGGRCRPGGKRGDNRDRPPAGKGDKGASLSFANLRVGQRHDFYNAVSGSVTHYLRKRVFPTLI